jgi:hypothetical protein
VSPLFGHATLRGVNRELMATRKRWVLSDQSAAMEDPNLTTVPLDFHPLAYQRKGHRVTVGVEVTR